MAVCVLRGPTLPRNGQNAVVNYSMLKDALESTREVCNALVTYLNHADTLPRGELPLEVPFTFAGDRVWTGLSHMSSVWMMPMQS